MLFGGTVPVPYQPLTDYTVAVLNNGRVHSRSRLLNYPSFPKAHCPPCFCILHLLLVVTRI